jgi:hypothetical protein
MQQLASMLVHIENMKPTKTMILAARRAEYNFYQKAGCSPQTRSCQCLTQ